MLINYVQLYQYCSLKVDILESVNLSGRNQTAKCFAPSEKSLRTPLIHNQHDSYLRHNIPAIIGILLHKWLEQVDSIYFGRLKNPTEQINFLRSCKQIRDISQLGKLTQHVYP